jgi:hypothetical protein
MDFRRDLKLTMIIYSEGVFSRGETCCNYFLTTFKIIEAMTS